MKKALVTGDMGFVGSRFRKLLEREGWTVHGCDIKRGHRYDARELFRTSTRHYDLVIHCAAIVGGRKVIDGNPLALASNLELDAGLFQWGLRSRPGRIVYFSSSAVYPNHLQTALENPGPGKYRLRETDRDPSLGKDIVGIPDQLYGWAKLTGENLAYRYQQEGGKVSVVRPFSGYGEDQDASYPFPAFIDRAIRREDPFQVWGNGRQVRDFIHITDIVHAVMTMYEHDIDGPVNLGWGQATALGDLAHMVCQATGYRPVIETLSDEPSGVQYRVCDPSKMEEFYAPEISLEEGIERALAYRSAHGPHDN